MSERRCGAMMRGYVCDRPFQHHGLHVGGTAMSNLEWSDRLYDPGTPDDDPDEVYTMPTPPGVEAVVITREELARRNAEIAALKEQLVDREGDLEHEVAERERAEKEVAELRAQLDDYYAAWMAMGRGLTGRYHTHLAGLRQLWNELEAERRAKAAGRRG